MVSLAEDDYLRAFAFIRNFVIMTNVAGVLENVEMVMAKF